MFKQPELDNLERVQLAMKTVYDRVAMSRLFAPGDQVLALIPLVSSPFQAKFLGPFTVVARVSAVNYHIAMPGRRRATRLCHVNLLQPYYQRPVNWVSPIWR